MRALDFSDQALARAQEDLRVRRDCNLTNEDVLVIAQIEGVDGIRNLSDILTVLGLAVGFLNSYDLSQSLGIPGELDHPRGIEAMKQVVEVAGRTDGTATTAKKTPIARSNVRSLHETLSRCSLADTTAKYSCSSRKHGG